MPQHCTDEDDRKPSWPSQELSHKAILSTWEGQDPWDPGGNLTGDDTIKSKGPVEAMDIALGIDTPQQKVAPSFVTHKKNPGCAEVESVCQYHPEEPTTHLDPSIIDLSHRRGVHPLFILGPTKRGTALSWVMQSRDITTRTRQCSYLVAITCSHTCPTGLRQAKTR